MIAESFEFVQTFEGAITVLVAVATLIWGIYKFLHRGEHLPRIQFDIKARIIDIHNKHALVLIKPALNNKGKVPIGIYDFSVKVYGFMADDPFTSYELKDADTTERDSRVVFKHLIHSKSILPSNWNFTFIRPNVIQNYNLVVSVPTTMRYIRVRGKFFYDMEKTTPHTSAVVIKLEPPRQSPAK